MMNPYYAIVYVVIQVLIAASFGHRECHHRLWSNCQRRHRIAWPRLHSFPCFQQAGIPLLGMARAFMGFCFYKVLAAAVFSILGHLLAEYYTQLVAFSDPGNMVQELPLLILLVFVNIYILFKIPAMTQSLFSGHTGGGSSGLGMAMMAIRAAI
jgi:hypothetical protein